MVELPARTSGHAEDGPDNVQSLTADGVMLPGKFSRSIHSEGISRPPSVHEIETHREHIRLNLENLEKQWLDVVRYERAKTKDEENKATFQRALARAATSLALAAGLMVPILTTDPAVIGNRWFWGLTIRDFLLVSGSMSIAGVIASLWWAGHIQVVRYHYRNSRTTPLAPPSRLTAVDMLASLENEGNPLYYMERDLNPDSKIFGWQPGMPPPPQPTQRSPD